jgi:hypothetical protein
MQWRLVFLNGREAREGLVKAVVGGIVVDAGYLANQSRACAFLAVERVVEPRHQRDALASLQDHLAAGRHLADTPSQLTLIGVLA